MPDGFGGVYRVEKSRAEEAIPLTDLEDEFIDDHGGYIAKAYPEE